MDWKTQPAASVWCASHHCILKDTIFGILLFFERLDDVRSFSNTDERFVFILKKMNGSFEPFTAFKRIDVLDGFPRITKQHVFQIFQIESRFSRSFLLMSKKDLKNRGPKPARGTLGVT